MSPLIVKQAQPNDLIARKKGITASKAFSFGNFKTVFMVGVNPERAHSFNTEQNTKTKTIESIVIYL